MKPIEPLVQSYHSFAIACVSRRDDGAPYQYNITLKNLGLYNPFGYKFYVSITDVCEVIHYKKN